MKDLMFSLESRDKLEKLGEEGGELVIEQGEVIPEASSAAPSSANKKKRRRNS